MIKQAVLDTLDAIQAAWEYVWPRLQAAVQAVVDWFQTNWPTIKQVFNDVKDAVIAAIDWITQHVDDWWAAIQAFYGWCVSTFWPGLLQMWNSIKDNIGPIIEDIYVIVKNILDKLKAVWDVFWPYLKDVIIGFAKAAILTIQNMWTFISGLFSGGIEIIRGVLDIIRGLMTGDWSLIWDGAKHIVDGFKTATLGIISAFWDELKGLFGIGIGVALQLIVDFKNDMETKFTDVWNYLKALPGKIASAVGDLSHVLWDAGKAVVTGFLGGLKDAWNGVVDWLGSRANIIKSLKGPQDYDKKILVDNGRAIMAGLQTGMNMGWADTSKWLSRLAPTMPSVVGVQSGFGSAPGGGTSITVAPGAVQLSVGDVRNQGDVDQIHAIVNDAFNRLVYEMNQPSYGGS
jgi:phage-related protein